MKVLIVGDPHFRHQLPYSTALPDGRASEWAGVKEQLAKMAAECDEVILMGDNFNSKHNHSSVNREFVEFLHTLGEKPVHMLVGNHERYGHETALDFIAEMKKPNWHVYNDIEKVSVGGKSAVMLPFMTPGVLWAKDLEEAQEILTTKLKEIGEADYLFHHHVAEGTLWSQTSETTDLHEVYVPQECIDLYQLVVGGHIHKRQWVSDKVLVTGNLFTNEVGEEDKAVYILNTEDNKAEEKKVNVRGIYKVEVRSDTSFDDIPDNAIVKAVVVDPELQGEGVNKLRNETLTRFDAFVVVEQYPRKRQKIQISEAGGLDLTLENLIKVYSEARKIPHTDLKAGLELLET